MAVRRTHRRREAQLAFEALSIEGSLLSPEWLARVAALGAGGQSEAEYRVPRGLNLRDEIGRYWRIAQAHWNDFSAGRAGGADASALSERFVTAFLRDVLGFVSLASTAPIEIAGRSYPIRHLALGTRAPVVIAPAASGIETLSVVFGDGTRRRNAFGLAQEFLNASDDALWGLACDGVTLRILRDNASLTRPAWIEADIARIFTEERYADFAALWLLAHETRFGSADKPPTDCALETWRNAGREEGTRALGDLRAGVREALVALGQGFLSHADNNALRAALQDGSFTKETYFQELLRLVYRVIFLLTVEERGVLHPDSATDVAKVLYAAGYSLHRLRDRSVRRSAHDRFSDLWEALTIVFRGTARGEARLGLPALAGLFAESQCAMLEASNLENRALLTAVFHLSWLREGTGLSRVNWRDMGPEELGGVYEGLLELVPQITEGGRRFGFASGAETIGNARRLTGSYYTPEGLVTVLLDSALEAVVERTIAEHPENPVAALLDLSVVDPACGSGHFLLAAARRIAVHVARIRANGTPSAAEYRHALREVVGRCVYGVDLNPMAVELCKVSLWMEAVEPGRPLSFLNSHIQRGNSLLGTTPELMMHGVPDDAWQPIEGDDKKIASALKKQNKKERVELTLDLSAPPASTYHRLGAGARAIDDAADNDLAALEAKGLGWKELLDSSAYRNAKFVADLWCSAFVWRKEAGGLRDVAPTDAVYRAIQKDPTRATLVLCTEVAALGDQYGFFHWHLAFPHVSAQGGFDVVLGNPPWERVKLQEQEFFASRSEPIANAPNAAARKRLIAALAETNPQLRDEWCAASRKAEGEGHFVRQSGRYPLCGRGDVNTYALFAENNRSALGRSGRAGFIVPTGIATDDTTKEYFRSLVESSSLRALYDFQTGPETFGNLAHGAQRFCLLTLSGSREDTPSDFVFFAKSAQDLRGPARHFSLQARDFEALNPNTRTCPTFRSRRDAELNLAIYRRVGVLWRDGVESGNPWGIRFMAMLHMANDSGLFRTRANYENAGARRLGEALEDRGENLVPLYEAKMIDHFDHRYASLVGLQASANRTSRKLVGWYSAISSDPLEVVQPLYWVRASDAEEHLSRAWARGWLLGWRDICRSTDQRTVIASVIPRGPVGHTMPLMFPDGEPCDIAALYANLCSFVLDYAARQKIGGTHLTYGYLKQFPVLTASTYAAPAPWHADANLRDWLLQRVLELTFTAWDIDAFARDLRYAGPPFRWDPSRRFALRCELDAAFFHLYGLTRDDAGYVMDTFPIVRDKDEEAHGEYRTKRVILEIFDQMAEATRSGDAYRTHLDPPPADPRVAHRPRGSDPSEGRPRRSERLS